MDGDHQAAVSAWLRASAGGASPDELVDLLEVGFAALWSRAQITLGDVTLGAILERVLVDTSEQHPVLTPLTVDATGLRFEALRAAHRTATAAELSAAIDAILVGFLTVLGNLTAEILTPALHAALSNATLARSDG